MADYHSMKPLIMDAEANMRKQDSLVKSTAQKIARIKKELVNVHTLKVEEQRKVDALQSEITSISQVNLMKREDAEQEGTYMDTVMSRQRQLHKMRKDDEAAYIDIQLDFIRKGCELNDGVYNRVNNRSSPFEQFLRREANQAEDVAMGTTETLPEQRTDELLSLQNEYATESGVYADTRREMDHVEELSLKVENSLKAMPCQQCGQPVLQDLASDDVAVILE